MFDVVSYEDARGVSSSYEFVLGLENRKLQAKVVGSLEVLAEKGNMLRGRIASIWTTAFTSFVARLAAT